MVAAKAAGKIRVVLVDDHAVMREGTRLILDGVDDIEVVAEAETGEDAVTLCAELKPDVVILDIKLRGMNGIEAAKRIKASDPECAILALTAYDYDQYVRAMIHAGARGYLLKNDSGQEVIEAVRLVSMGGSPLSACIATQIVEDASRSRSSVPIPKASAAELSDREFEVLRSLASGMRNTQIAEQLGITTNTVESHVKHICAKLGANSRGEAVVVARLKGLLALDELME